MSDPVPEPNRLQIDDSVLSDSVLTLWGEATELLHGDVEPPPRPRDFTSAAAMLNEAGESLLRAIGSGTAGHGERAAGLLTVLRRLSDQLNDARMARRGLDLTLVRQSVARLRGCTSRQELTVAAPAELCACGFDRAMVSRFDGRWWVPERVHDSRAPRRGRAALEAMRSRRVALDDLEGAPQMIRQQAPTLSVSPGEQGGHWRWIAGELGISSYVAAPIVLDGVAIGLVHADRYTASVPVDEFDRDLIAAFAEGLGHVHDRVALLDRVSALRREIRQLSSALTVLVDESAGAEVALDRTPDRTALGTNTVAGGHVDPATLLTRRERDVMRLLALGETNARIAEQLFVSEGTVKSHVKRILRKLRAANRAEAVSRYTEMARRAARDEIGGAAQWQRGDGH